MGCNSKILGRNDYSLIRLFLGCGGSCCKYRGS
jgi:hypothetical protein